jgi:hypothetical protein
LKNAGYTECFAVLNEPGYIQHLPPTVASEPAGDMPTCYLLSVGETDFLEFNDRLGAFRSVLTTEDRTWAISCNEWYNLFGAAQPLLDQLLGKAADEARREFLDFAYLLARGDPKYPLLQAASYYAEI